MILTTAGLNIMKKIRSGVLMGRGKSPKSAYLYLPENPQHTNYLRRNRCAASMFVGRKMSQRLGEGVEGLLAYIYTTLCWLCGAGLDARHREEEARGAPQDGLAGQLQPQETPGIHSCDKMNGGSLSVFSKPDPTLKGLFTDYTLGGPRNRLQFRNAVYFKRFAFFIIEIVFIV